MAHSSDVTGTTRFPWLTGLFLLVGFGLIYWAYEQALDIQEITGSTFHNPTGRTLLWQGTMILSGIVFGLALAATRDRVERPRAAALLWGVIPLAVLVYYTLFISGTIPWPQPLRLTMFLFAGITIATSSLLVGLFIATAVAPFVLPSGRRH